MNFIAKVEKECTEGNRQMKCNGERGWEHLF